MLDTDFGPKIEEEISLMRKFLGLLRNALFSYSAGLPKEYSFQ
jgi:hypothetical protein